MVIAILVVFGLALGSFVNALVWRLHEQDKEISKKRPNKGYIKDLSISKGRSMCPHCKHTLGIVDLVPVLSWLSVGGKCRYCRKPISAQYPVVELLTATLFVGSYIWWPIDLSGWQVIVFSLWLLVLVGFVALIVYDLRWMLLPNRIIGPLCVLAGVMAIIMVLTDHHTVHALVNEFFAVLVGGGIFYVLFQISAGRWIGGGDVKLGFMLGLIAATPARSFLVIFLAAIIGTICSLPLLITKRLKQTSLIPFGPMLIIGLIIVQLFGHDLLHWYMSGIVPMR